MVRVVLGSILLFLSVSVAGAQQGTSELRGRVIDQQGAVLPGVAIVVHQPGQRHSSVKPSAAPTARSS